MKTLFAKIAAFFKREDGYARATVRMLEAHVSVSLAKIETDYKAELTRIETAANAEISKLKRELAKVKAALPKKK